MTAGLALCGATTMYSPRVKAGICVVEGLNSLATALYFTYLFFLMREEFGFTNLGNLFLCAVNGLVYAGFAWVGGRVGQRRGYFFALRLGCALMAAALLVGHQMHGVAGLFATMMVWTLGMCFTWPNLEAIVSEHESPARLQRWLGIYNLVWAFASSLASLVGGALYERLGREGIFLLPAVVHLAQLILLARLGQAAPAGPAPLAAGEASAQVEPDHSERARSVVPPAVFLTMAWVANPFAYIAINALVPVIPRLAERFHLSPMYAGFCCSVWFFARAFSFWCLWRWTGWHYRFRWLVGAYVAMIASFLLVLQARSLMGLLAAQVVFGLAIGLMYYSSLYYSMDVGETKGEHGGFHETAIGIGICVGPAVGATSLKFFPDRPSMNAWTVALLLVGGLVWLLILRWRRARQGRGRAG